MQFLGELRQRRHGRRPAVADTFATHNDDVTRFDHALGKPTPGVERNPCLSFNLVIGEFDACQQSSQRRDRLVIGAATEGQGGAANIDRLGVVGRDGQSVRRLAAPTNDQVSTFGDFAVRGSNGPNGLEGDDRGAVLGRRCPIRHATELVGDRDGDALPFN